MQKIRNKEFNNKQMLQASNDFKNIEKQLKNIKNSNEFNIFITKSLKESIEKYLKEYWKKETNSRNKIKNITTNIFKRNVITNNITKNEITPKLTDCDICNFYSLLSNENWLKSNYTHPELPGLYNVLIAICLFYKKQMENWHNNKDKESLKIILEAMIKLKTKINESNTSVSKFNKIINQTIKEIKNKMNPNNLNPQILQNFITSLNIKQRGHNQHGGLAF